MNGTIFTTHLHTFARRCTNVLAVLLVCWIEDGVHWHLVNILSTSYIAAAIYDHVSLPTIFHTITMTWSDPHHACAAVSLLKLWCTVHTRALLTIYYSMIPINNLMWSSWASHDNGIFDKRFKRVYKSRQIAACVGGPRDFWGLGNGHVTKISPVPDFQFKFLVDSPISIRKMSNCTLVTLTLRMDTLSNFNFGWDNYC